MPEILEGKLRQTKKRSDLRKLREYGNIPAVLYGYNTESKSVSVNEIDFLKAFRSVGKNGVISLQIGNEKKNVMVHAYQSNELRNEITHIDFLTVDMNAETEAEVRIELTGDSQGVRDGGVLQQPLYEINITAKPADIPETVPVDISNLQVKETLTVGEIRSKFPFTINHEDDELIASVLPPRQEEEISTGETQSAETPDNLEGRETEAE